jgi:hypothetical protein
MLRRLAAFVALLSPVVAFASVEPYPASLQTRMVPTNGTRLYVRFGGRGPAVVLLHGFGDTGDMWAPLAAALDALKVERAALATQGWPMPCVLSPATGART